MPTPPAISLLRLLPILLASLALLPVAPAPAEEPPALPPKPATHILDDLHVLTPAQTTALSARLIAAARDPGVHVFLLTVPRRTTDEMEALANELTKTWTKGDIGAVIVFDDDTGKSTIATSERVDRDFSTLEVNIVLHDQLLATASESGLSRDKLVHTATIIATEFSKLKSKADRAAKGRFQNSLIIGAIALVGIGLAVFSALAKPKAPASPASTPPGESDPPADF